MVAVFDIVRLVYLAGVIPALLLVWYLYRPFIVGRPLAPNQLAALSTKQKQETDRALAVMTVVCWPLAAIVAVGMLVTGSNPTWRRKKHFPVARVHGQLPPPPPTPCSVCGERDRCDAGLHG